MTRLDLTKLPQISDSTGFLKYDPFDEFPELKGLNEISERIYGCAHFNIAVTDVKYPTYSEKAQLRATLNEFVSISEILTKKYPDITIDKTDLPILHFLKELRVTNFHLKTFTPKIVKGKLVLVNTTTGEKNLGEFEVEHFIIENCNLDLFSENYNYKKYYSSLEFEKTVEWVDENQKAFGITHIVEAALKQYCELIKNTVANNG